MPSPISDHTVRWPDADTARYVVSGYWAGKPIGHLLREVADGGPAAPALVDPSAGLRLSYAELATRADACATRLHRLGLAPGDRMLVQLPNGWEFVVLTLACLRAGIVPVMAMPAHRRTELGYLAAHAEASAIAVPDRIRDFDHQAMAHALAAQVQVATGGPWHGGGGRSGVRPHQPARAVRARD
jgi:2,3-dihydroxybenzoate-AMP ligase